MKTIRFSILAAMLGSTLAAAADVEAAHLEAPGSGGQKLGLFAGMGYLSSPGAHGSALSAGLRLAMGRHVALSFDLGYGLLSADPIVHDRWWAIPSIAFVIPAGPVRLDIGAGLGLGASSGYSSWDGYKAGPFMPDWAFQLVPTARAHAIAAVALNQSLDLFVRADVASLLLEGNSIGFRAGNLRPGVMDTTWVNLWVGIQFGLL